MRVTTRVEPADLADHVANEVGRGGRFAGLFASPDRDDSTLLQTLIARDGLIETTESLLPSSRFGYPALTPLVPAAGWYEREIHDLFGIVPEGHPRLDPLVLPRAAGQKPPRPGGGTEPDWIEADEAPLPGHVSGEGVFTIPYGPVRSGVFESVEYLVETPGEEIPHLRTRIYHKHRGVEARFAELSVEDGVLMAERVEGTSSVAHAMAFAQAIESLAGVEPDRGAELIRAMHAELERIAAHLDSVVRHTEGAGQAVAYARMSRHKEGVLRLRADLCGHRFGRGVVIPGGVTQRLAIDSTRVLAAVDELESAIAADARALMATPSFLDRLRGTGPLPPEVASLYGALGPLGRGSGIVDDVRVSRPYGAYRFLGFEPAAGHAEGDAMARQRVRWAEISQSFHLIRQALDELSELKEMSLRKRLPALDGAAISSVEAPQGELIYLVKVENGRLAQVKVRTASFHNLAIFPQAFRGDIFTDFVFIEASFGVSIAGAAG